MDIPVPCAYLVPKEVQEGVGCPKTGVQVLGATMEVLGPNPGLLEEQSVLLTAEPSLHPHPTATPMSSSVLQLGGYTQRFP